MSHARLIASAAIAFVLISGCKSNQMTEGLESAGEAVADGAEEVAGSAVSLVNVDLSNVLNDLALDLNIDRANIPVNAQIPITIAANICGVSINILSVSAGGDATCTATTTSPELTQIVQQQLSAGGSVGGGEQTTEPTTPTDTTTTDDSATEQETTPPQ